MVETSVLPKLRLGFKVLTVTLLLVGLFSLVTIGKEAPNTLKIGFLPAEDELPLFVGLQRGDFARAGVDLQLITFASAIERDTAFRAGQLDGIVTDLVAVGLFGKGKMPVKMSSITLGAKPSEGRFALLAGPKSGIKGVPDLKDVPVAISNNSIIEFVTYQLLISGGLKDNEIKTLEIPKVPVRLEMLINGQVAAATLPDPFAALAEARGAKVIASDTDATVNLSPIVYVFTTQALEKKAETLQRFYATYSQIVQDINADSESFRNVMLEYCRIPKGIEEIYPVPAFPLPTVPTESEWDLVMDWMTRKGILKKPLPYAQYVTTTYVTK